MSFLFSLLLLVILAACVGFLYREGMWDNALRLVNVILAALVATAGCGELASRIRQIFPSYMYLVDYFTIWSIFCVCYILLRSATAVLSRVQVRFLKLADRIGGVVFAVLLGWVMVCFTLTTLHAAPLGKNFFFEAFQPNEPMFLGFLAPDREWMGFVAYVTEGAYGGDNVEPFIPEKFVEEQTTRRIKLEKHLKDTGHLRTDEQ